MFNKRITKADVTPVAKKNRGNIVMQFGRFLAGRKSKRLTHWGLMLMIIAFIAACENQDKKKNCDYDLGLYNDAKETAASDSVTFVNHKNNAPDVFNSLVKAYMEEGMTESEAIEAAINNLLNNPNATEEWKRWARTYKELWDKFQSSVTNRGQTYTNWWQCENSDK